MSVAAQVLLIVLLAPALYWVAVVCWEKRRRKPEGWMHECEMKQRQVWFPIGASCTFCRKELG